MRLFDYSRLHAAHMAAFMRHLSWSLLAVRFSRSTLATEVYWMALAVHELRSCCAAANSRATRHAQQDVDPTVAAAQHACTPRALKCT
jgi:hypothetical protein